MTDVTRRQSNLGMRFVLAVVVPLVVACAAYGLSWLSDELLVIGPFDRAAFGWIFVIPTWLATAPAAALMWMRLPIRERRLAASSVGLVVGVAAMLVTWKGSSSPDCEFGAIATPLDDALRAVILGAVVGATPAVGGLIGAARGHGRRSRTIVVGFGAGIAMALSSFAVLAALLSIPACQRPPI